MLVHGHKLLDDTEAERRWLQSLEEIASARHLAADYVHFDLFFEDYYAAGEEPVAVRLEMLDRWVQRFPMRWENEDFSTGHSPYVVAPRSPDRGVGRAGTSGVSSGQRLFA